jgi:hypothetical protein
VASGACQKREYSPTVTASSLTLFPQFLGFSGQLSAYFLVARVFGVDVRQLPSGQK